MLDYLCVPMILITPYTFTFNLLKAVKLAAKGEDYLNPAFWASVSLGLILLGFVGFGRYWL